VAELAAAVGSASDSDSDSGRDIVRLFAGSTKTIYQPTLFHPSAHYSRTLLL